MTFRTDSGPRFDTADRIIAYSLALLLLAACDRNSTSSPPTADAVTIAGGAAQTGVVAAALAAPIVVRVTDQSGNAVAGALVTFTPAAQSGSVSSAQVTSDASGNAQVSWTLGTLAGADSLVVTVGSAPAMTVVATASPDVAANIVVASGDQQAAPAGGALATPLAVRVTDRFGNPVPNASVQWTSDAGGALTTSTTLTDANGLTQDALTLGLTAGTDDVTAMIMVNGVAADASFTEQGT